MSAVSAPALFVTRVTERAQATVIDITLMLGRGHERRPLSIDLHTHSIWSDGETVVSPNFATTTSTGRCDSDN